LGRGVPAFNNAVKRLAENSVVRILNDGRKAGVGLLGAFPRGYFQTRRSGILAKAPASSVSGVLTSCA